MPPRRDEDKDDIDPKEDEYDEQVTDDEDEEEEEEDRLSRKRKRSDFIDDAVEEDDDEKGDEDDDDEDYDDGGRKQKDKKRCGSQFFDLEAQVDSDEDDEEEEGEDDFIVDGGAELPDEDDGRRMYCRPLLPRDDQDEDVEDLERKIQARYARSSHTEFEEETTNVQQQALLPSVRDPKLWMVKCAIGHEREAVVCLMQKCIDNGSELQIRSAIALHHLKKFIYIEADKEAHVKEACKGLRNLYAQKVMLVPLREMSDVLSVESKAIDVCTETWVRMKIGNYKGDLANVVDVDNVRQRVTVKLIPRIDLQALAKKLEGREVGKKKSFVPPRRFNVEEARELHIRVERRREPMTGDYFEKIGRMLFKDGFLYKTVSMKSISAQNIKPTFNELEKFGTPGENGKSNVASLSSLFTNRKKGNFMKGDAVIVIKGDLKTLKGWVERVDEETVQIKPEMTGLPKTLAVNQKELRKYFETGNHVKVVSGMQEGATGMVVKVDQHVLVILSDTTKEHIRVFADDVVKNSCYPKTPPRMPQSPRIFSRGGTPNDSGGRHSGRRGGHDALVGTTVKVRQGPFKGYRGRVVGVKGQSVRVELDSQMKVITVDRSSISDNVVLWTPYREPPCYGIGSETPMRDASFLNSTPSLYDTPMGDVYTNQ